LLTEEEQRSICVYREGGRRMPIPTLPMPGINDNDAGIQSVAAAEKKAG
jgi:hypothetical protein